MMAPMLRTVADPRKPDIAPRAALAERPTTKWLPGALGSDIGLDVLLHVNYSRRLHFQSALQANTWARVRGEYVARAAEMV